MRVCEFQFDCDSGRGHWSAGSEPEVGFGEGGDAGCDGEDNGEFHVGMYCGDAAVDMSAASDFIQSRCSLRPRTAVVLGSGLGGFADGLRDQIVIDYHE